MQYIINRISELIEEKTPSHGGEAIILINGFERLRLYQEIAAKLNRDFEGSGLSLNIKLAKRKWEDLSQDSDTITKQTMQQKGWVAEKESVTFYRNQHNVDVLILMGTENEDDTGGLANCFTITPDWLFSDLDGHYDRIFEKCFTYEITEDDRLTINDAYQALFEYSPANICKLSDIADSWLMQFDTLSDFCEGFGKSLPEWGLPPIEKKPYTPNKMRSKKNFLHGENDYISGKLFLRMSQRAYKGLMTKLDCYKDEGAYSGRDVAWASYGFEGYDDLARTLLEFARGENVSSNRKRLLKVDYTIIDDILKVKVSGPSTVKISEKNISGEPLEIVLRTLLSALRIVKDKNRSDATGIQYDFSSATIVTGYTDTDDEDKLNALAEVWKNICVHTNGVFDYINQNAWECFGEPIQITCETPDFFDPKKVIDQLDNTVTAATGTNTLNRISFAVKLVDENGNTLQDEDDKELAYYYSWRFGNDASWLYDFRDLILTSNLSVPHAAIVPVGVMHHIKNTMVIKSEEEFFDIYNDNPIDLSFDFCKYIDKRMSGVNDTNLKYLSVLFSDLGEVFCEVVSKISNNGFYKVLCEGTLTSLNDKYLKIADKLLSIRLDEDKQWIKDVFLQAFSILENPNFIDEDKDPVCVIIPPWHPAALQKIAAQKRFLIDGLSQRFGIYDETGSAFNVDDVVDRLIRMTEIQSSIDLFPSEGNDYMGVMGTYGHFCVYGNDRNVSAIRTRMKDVLRKEAIYDEEFKASELTKLNDDARMIYDVFRAYIKAMPSVKNTLSIVFINPPDLQPIISAISKYTKEIHANDEDAVINLTLSILVRPENKGGKSYLTYWMNEYFSEERKTNVRVYLNEWSKKHELDKLLSDNNDIVFDMDLLHSEAFRFSVNNGESSGRVADCRFPIVYKPSPISKTSKRRKIEITQTQFSTSFKFTQVARYKKNPETIPTDTFLAVRETSVESETKQIIDMLHKKAYWVVCIDKVMDGALLRTDSGESEYAVIGFSTGKGMYGQYNLTITARNSIIETVERRLSDRLYRLFKWKPDILNSAVKTVMNEAKSLDGISVLSAINPKGTNINEFMAYVMTSLREKKKAVDAILKVIIHLDSYKHWFDNSEIEESSSRPDFLLLSVLPSDSEIKMKATVIECKTASYSQHYVHTEHAKDQVRHGLEQLKRIFDPNSTSIERRYWYAQLYRALVFAQVTFSDSSNAFQEISGKLRSVIDGNFQIDWDGVVLGYWVDLPGDTESCIEEDGVKIFNIPQGCIQGIITGGSATAFVPVEDEILEEMDEISEEETEREEAQDLRNRKEEILNRRKKNLQKRQQKELDEVLSKSSKKENLEVTQKSETEKVIKSPREEVKVETKKENVSEVEAIGVTVEDSNTKSGETHTVSSVSGNELSDVRVLIGNDKSGNAIYWEFGSKHLSNRHLLITGTSGQGKTYGIQSMLYEVSKSNVSMVVFDYTEGFRTDQLEKKFLDKMEGRIDNRIIYFTGVPINPFKRHEIEVSGMKAPEKIADVAQRIASTLTHVYKFGDQQFAAIYDACYSGLSKYGDHMSMAYLESELNASSNKSAKTVVSKMTPFLHSVEFSDEHCDWDDILYSKDGKLTIFQLTNFVRDIQVIITEFMLWDMWHYTKKNGNKDKPFAVVLDEAQNLSHADNSPSGLILTEGRKFGWSAWYATQSLKVLNDDEVTRLMQAAFKLYFKPTDDEIISMAKQLNPSDANEWKQHLLRLKKGECIVVGPRIQKDGQFRSGKPTITKVLSFEERA